ncbi:MAG: stalk domain-containing protein [Armatimonadota bacterium]
MHRHLLLYILLAWCVAIPLGAAIMVETPDVLLFGTVEMVPLAPVVEIAGGAMTQSVAGVVTVKRGGKSFVCTLGKTAGKANGKAVTLPLAPFAKGLVVFVPVRPLAAALGGTCALKNDTLQMKLPGGKTLALPRVKMISRWTVNGGALSVAKYRDSEPQIYVMPAKGGNLHRLTYRVQGCALPLLTPNGSRWVYQQLLFGLPYGSLFTRALDTPQPTVLRKVDADATNVACLTPQLTPDGASVLFSEVVGRTSLSLYRLPIAGGVPVKLAMATGACSSPDGNTLAGLTIDPLQARSALSLLDANGGAPRQLGPGEDVTRFSPDGRTVLTYYAYTQELRAVKSILVYRTDTGVIAEPAADARAISERDAVFTPDSTQIVFVREKTGLAVMHTDRTNLRSLTDGPTDASPAVTPDGKQVYFVRKGNIYRINLDGAGLTRLTNTTLNIKALTLSPDGARLFLTATAQ